jgi:L-alanine-DL-glutamate epimerase-like enolase superfamily enzyme
MDLMLDSFCHYQTFADAVRVGRACDEGHYFWYEDPYGDGGITPFSHAKLRELVKTPLLMGEKLRNLQERMAFVLAGATDFVRGEVGTEGITGTLKMAHAAESVGLDLELHGAGPAQRHVMAALRNTNYYEQVWVHPVVTSTEPPVYQEGYVPGLAAVGSDGCVPVPEGPGLGVVYDWDFITRHSTGTVTVAADP